MTTGSSTNQRWRQIQTLFDLARKLSGEQREELLQRECTDDALRAEVTALLQHHDRAADSFLEDAADESRGKLNDIADTVNRATADPLIGLRVGRYHIRSVIASGGMSTVYQAVQEQPHRVVALKVMNNGLTARSVLRRFEFESQILARLRHPNIAQVYEAGVAEIQLLAATAQPKLAHEPSCATPSADRDSLLPVTVAYFAMEYIPGARSITEYASEKQLDLRQRLALFAKVCDAAHHGHQKGIIHRDLKPANILVTDEVEAPNPPLPTRSEAGVGALVQGSPKIIDFGVARATDADLSITTQQTSIGELIGTMNYMSPEQCAGDPLDLDTRSDVYSLGVVLYELLTGVSPYDAAGSTIHSIQQAPHVIHSIVPPPPSAVLRRTAPVSAGRAKQGEKASQTPIRASALRAPMRRQVRAMRGDVDTIVATALAKDRNRRYASAAELAADVRRYLAREPITARPPRAWERLVRSALRRPVVATGLFCLAMFITTVTATCVTVWLINERPYRVDPNPAGSEVWLKSYTNKTLHEWSIGRPNEERCAELVARPPEFGGGMVAVIRFEPWTGLLHENELCAFDANRPGDPPCWIGRVAPEEIMSSLASLRQAHAEEFFAQHAMVTEVFDEVSGPEIVAIFNRGSHSQKVVRIYDLGGDVRFEFWYDGALELPYWIAHPGMLVFVGSHASTAYDETSNLRPDGRESRVIFGIVPMLDQINRDEFMRLGAPGSGPRPQWSLRMVPSDLDLSGGERSVKVQAPLGPGHDVAREVQLVIGFPKIAEASWVFNSNGQVLTRPDLNNQLRHTLSENSNRPNSGLIDPQRIGFVPWKAE